MFNMSKNNLEDEQINLFYFYEKEQFLVLWALFATIVIGNVAVFIILYKNKRRSRVNLFIQHLAIADISIGIINVLVDIIWRITVSWLAGDFACKLIKFLQCLVIYASNYILVALSIDRFGAVVRPMSFTNARQRVRWLLYGAWVVSALFSLPQFFLYEVTEIQGHTQCWIEFDEQWHWQIYMTIVAILLFFIPVTIISICYGSIIKKIWMRGKRKRNNSNSDVFNSFSRESSQGIIPRAKVKILKMTFLIVVVFVACWSPYVIFDLLQVYDQIPRTQTNIAIATFVQSLAALNSATNPLIYCFFSLDMPKVLEFFVTLFCYPHEFFCRRCRGNSIETPDVKLIIVYHPATDPP